MNETILLIIIILTIFTVTSKISKQKKRQKIAKQKKQQKIASFNFEQDKEAAHARELKAKESLAIKKERQEAERKSHNERIKRNDELMKEYVNSKKDREEALEKAALKRAMAEKAKLKRKENFIKKYNKASLLLRTNGILPLRAVVEKTGDEKRYKDFLAECKQTHTQDKYLYLVKIKSNIDDKKFIKIGITSYKDIKKRFEDDDVIEIIEVIRSIKFDTRVAMAIEFNLIQKHRPKDYFAENEFDVFSRFSGYTEVIPMRYTKAITKDIDLLEKESQLFTDAFDVISKVKKELKKNIFLWSDLPNL
jgi:hypothetical protein